MVVGKGRTTFKELIMRSSSDELSQMPMLTLF